LSVSHTLWDTVLYFTIVAMSGKAYDLFLYAYEPDFFQELTNNHRKLSQTLGLDCDTQRTKVHILGPRYKHQLYKCTLLNSKSNKQIEIIHTITLSFKMTNPVIMRKW
jgi:hypothetical protein